MTWLFTPWPVFSLSGYWSVVRGRVRQPATIVGKPAGQILCSQPHPQLHIDERAVRLQLGGFLCRLQMAHDRPNEAFALMVLGTAYVLPEQRE